MFQSIRRKTVQIKIKRGVKYKNFIPEKVHTILHLFLTLYTTSWNIAKIITYMVKSDFFVSDGWWKFLWDCQLDRYMSVCRDLWQPPEMSVWHTKSLTSQFSMYIKFENIIGLEILRSKLLLQMTYSLTWLKNAKLYSKRKNVLLFRLTTL